MVIGIDSHKDVLMGCLINNKTRPVEYRSVKNTPRGHSEVVSWVRSCGAGRVAVEGSGNYGRPLAQALAGAGFNVVEVPPQMTAHARKGQRTNTKNDHTDALLIARIGARDHDLPAPRPDGEIEDLRCLVYYRRELVETRNRHVNRLHSDLEQLHCGYHHNIPTRLTTPTALTKASYLLRGDNNTRAGVAKRQVRIRHIRRVELNRQIDDLATQITARVHASKTTLTNIYGVGALVAAEILAGVGDPTRYTTKAKFAMANGTAPLEASSGRVVRHRLNQGRTAATANSTKPSTPSPSPKSPDQTPKAEPTTNANSLVDAAKPKEKPSDPSNAAYQTASGPTSNNTTPPPI